MVSIFQTFKGLHKNGAPLDLLATWRKTFDKASEREVALFQKMYCDEWFDWNTPQMSLTAEAIVGKYRIRFMATLLGDESPTPLRRSDGFDIWTKEIPRVGHKFPMAARDYRKLLEIYENPRLKEADKVRAIEKTLKHDMQDAYLGCKDVMDFITLTMMTNWGVCQFTPDVNNPGGRRYEVDYLMGEQNKLMSAFNWTTANTAANKVQPILMLAMICADLRTRGIEPGEILMSQDLYFWLKMDATTRLMAHGTDKQAKVVTESEMQTLLSENKIPEIRVITRKFAIDRDGVRKTLEPWNHNFICIKPAGKIGEIQPAIEDSELMEEENVDYMNAGNGIRIAKWRTGESTNQVAAEYTQGSARLLPLITEIDAIICLQVRGITEKQVPAVDGNDRMYWTKYEYDNGTAPSNDALPEG
ncbi:MAG: hypothetical protein K6E94_00525 [Elusimicrobiaceae bacterium]|nr:hypothetical protein [Elusimicrobiaceae bacterium]